MLIVEEDEKAEHLIFAFIPVITTTRSTSIYNYAFHRFPC